MSDFSQIESSIVDVRKRDGRITNFKKDKISNAVFKALEATGKLDREIADELASGVVSKLVEQGFSASNPPSVEDIQDMVESTLIDKGHGESYSQGLVFDAHEIEEMDSKSEKIVECNKMTKILNGGLLVQLKMPDGSNPSQIKNTIEKASNIFDSFKPIKKIPICGNCGLKDEKLQEKCPSCKSPYIIT